VKRKKTERRSDCPINFGLDLFGDKWTLLIIRDLLFVGKKHFGDFLDSDEKIATNILTDRLLKLENQGVISKKLDPVNNTRFIYTLTDKGIDLAPILIEIILWSAKYDARTAAPRATIKRIRQDREGFIKEIREKYKQI
jgi:DNA-binding HxlR family transcriptional regulator